MDWDVFISHAWEDKEDIARPLAEALRRKGLRVWYDEFTLTLGDSLRRSIDRGLAQSRYGVVILSPYFFAKEWPQKELDGLAAREVGSGKVILPVWHNVKWEDVRRFSPMLAGKLAVSTAKGLDAVVEEILRALGADGEPPPPPPLAPKKRKIKIAMAIAIIGVIGVLIALGAWLVPNAAGLLSTWLSETPVAAVTPESPTDMPTVTPTSGPTQVPVISTATPTNTSFAPTAPPTFTPLPLAPKPVPSTDTPTSIPPTPTPVLPTATPVVPTPTLHLTGKITYLMRDGIYVMDADGNNRRRVYEGDVGRVALSPDGNKIAFVKREGEDGVWLIDVDGSNTQRIVDPGAIDEVAWAPDSNQILYEGGSSTWYIVKITDGMPKQEIGVFRMRNPAWSPDGGWFAYSSDRGLMKRPVSGGPEFVLDSSIDWWFEGQPAWSPDGARIAYLKDGDIFVINADGSGQKNLTDHPALDRYPRWSSDGSKIFFTSDRDGNSEVYVMNSDGSNQTNLTNSAEDERSATEWMWSWR